MYKVLVTARSFGRFSQKPFQIIEEAGYGFIDNPWPGCKLTEEQLLKLIDGADALICGEDPVSEKVIKAAPKLKVIAKFGVGVDKIDLNAAAARGIAVCNTPGANNESVADMAFSLMLGVARNLPSVDRLVREGNWQPVVGCELYKKTLGIVGLGKIGKGVACRAKGFTMKVLAYDEYPDKEFMDKNSIEAVSLEDLLQRSDFVSLHVPSLPQTKGLIGAKQLSMMKCSAYLINTARGDIVDENALFNTLQTGQIAGAGLDVFAKEPPLDCPLLKLPNVVLAPHIAAHTVEAIDNMGLMSACNVIDILSKKKNNFIVNLKALRKEADYVKNI